MQVSSGFPNGNGYSKDLRKSPKPTEMRETDQRFEKGFGRSLEEIQIMRHKALMSGAHILFIERLDERIDEVTLRRLTFFEEGHASNKERANRQSGLHESWRY